MTAVATPELAIPRDRWGRPLILPADPDDKKARAYTRVSTLAKALDDTTALTDWKCRQVAIGLDARKDLRAMVSVAKGDRRELNTIIKAALDAAQSDAAANLGTALHSFAQHVDEGGDLDGVPPDYRPHIQAYQATMAAHGITPVACERFIVNDDIEAAGTFDRLLVMPDGRFVIGDIKTGSAAPAYALATAIQVAVYARGVLYDPDKGRTPLPPIDLTTGVLIHLRQDEPVCELHELNLTEGWMAALVAFDVRRLRKEKHWASPMTTPPTGDGNNPTQPNKGDNK
jgi:hypothetical protein